MSIVTVTPIHAPTNQKDLLPKPFTEHPVTPHLNTLAEEALSIHYCHAGVFSLCGRWLGLAQLLPCFLLPKQTPAFPGVTAGIQSGRHSL